MKFEKLDLNVELLKGIISAGLDRCTPVQEQSLPESLLGKDIIAQSQTGTGKTAVFILTILNKLVTAGEKPGKSKALIVVPTRELATQVDQEAKKFGKYLPFRSLAVYGGVGYEKQESELARGVDIITATPGRLIDLYKSKTLRLDSIDQFIIDEADRMFDMGFIPDIRYIANQLPKKTPRQTMLFSATLENKVTSFAAQYMKPDPVLVEIEPDQLTVNLIDQKLVYVSNEEKLSVLMGLLKRDEMERVIIFTNMKRTAERLGWKLDHNGFPAKVLTGDVSQTKRQRIMDSMKSGKVRVLIATDVAARGLHIEGVSPVINYDLPNEAVNYVHRIGRTARAGKEGKSYSLACEDHVLNLPEIEKFIEHKIEKEWLDESEMVEDKEPPYPTGRVFPKKNEKGPGQRKPFRKVVSLPVGKGAKTPKKLPKEDRKKMPSSKKKRNSLPSSAEGRIAYYKKKYGEDFSPRKEKPPLTNNEIVNTTKQASSGSQDKKKKENKKGILKSIFKALGK